MNFPTMQRLTGHDNTPDAPGQATSTGDSLAGRPAGVMVVFRSGTAAGCWLAYSSYEEEKDVGRISRDGYNYSSPLRAAGWWRACWSGKLTMIILWDGTLEEPCHSCITLPRGSACVAQLI